MGILIDHRPGCSLPSQYGTATSATGAAVTWAGLAPCAPNEGWFSGPSCPPHDWVWMIWCVLPSVQPITLQNRIPYTQEIGGVKKP